MGRLAPEWHGYSCTLVSGWGCNGDQTHKGRRYVVICPGANDPAASIILAIYLAFNILLYNMPVCPYFFPYT
jgi:hypothetical protein